MHVCPGIEEHDGLSGPQFSRKRLDFVQVARGGHGVAAQRMEFRQMNQRGV
jgi:hypothetical protein